MSFADRLDAATADRSNPCLVGIDPHLDLLPDEFAVARDRSAPRADRAAALADFCCQLVEVVAPRVAIVKPQSAFFEQLGADGAVAWERVVAAARGAGLLVLGDVKRGDIGSTATAYAHAFLGAGEDDPTLCDAITINPYLGGDATRPFLDACREMAKGVFVLVRTSNPGGSDFQEPGDPSLCDRVARAVDAWGSELVGECGLSSVGAVVGATRPSELERLRALMPRTPFLIPGYGAQGAGAEDAAPGFLPGGRGALVAASRSVAFAHRAPANAGRDWREAASEALDAMIADVRAALGLSATR